MALPINRSCKRQGINSSLEIQRQILKYRKQKIHKNVVKDAKVYSRKKNHRLMSSCRARVKPEEFQWTSQGSMVKRKTYDL